jgi:Glycosyl transferase family 2
MTAVLVKSDFSDSEDIDLTTARNPRGRPGVVGTDGQGNQGDALANTQTDRTVSESGRRQPATEELPLLSVVIPCLNEADTVGPCIDAAIGAMQAAGITGEVLVVDNGSTDGSQEIATARGARVVLESTKGYGSALRRGCEDALGTYILMGDADESYDFSQIQPFIEGLQGGADLVMGTRIRGTILPGAMPWKNRHVGNPLSTGLLNRLFRAGISDVHCGMRAITKDAYRSLDLRTTGMEFASEMVIRAAMTGMEIAEVPITFRPDGRNRPPHLRPWRDGWRHLKTILIFSPTALFLVPGLTLVALGLVLMAVQMVAPLGEPLRFFGFRMDFHWAILGSLLALVGYQIVLVNFFAKVYAVTQGTLSEDPILRRALTVLTLERVLLVALLVTIVGLGLDGFVAWRWLRTDLGPLVSGYTRLFVFGSTLVALGMQTIFSAFFFSILRDDYGRRLAR